MFSAGRERLRGPGRAGVPHVIAPGCIDMVNFHSMHSVPAHLREDASRLFYEWNPNVVLMRTNKAELDQIVCIKPAVHQMGWGDAFVSQRRRPIGSLKWLAVQQDQ